MYNPRFMAISPDGVLFAADMGEGAADVRGFIYRFTYKNKN
jgi:hypothetical protein